MDPHHVHNFWGVSHALDVRDVVRRCRAKYAGTKEVVSSDETDDPFSTLLVGTNDPRHIFTTLARSRRHNKTGALKERSLSFHVYESNMAETARHVLLLCVLMTDDLPPSDRVERFLEIFMNATLRDSTAELVERLAERLERVVGAIFAGEAEDTPEIKNDRITQVFDFSLLKFKEKDELMECFRSWKRAGEKTPFDADAARDKRLRKYYGDRFDHRKNIVDWDYNMRLDAAGAGVIHFKHFAEFRLTGIAYPVREATFPAPNRTLVSFAKGTTKEFKDRDCNDKGRKVETRGFWCDILNSPYHCYGTHAEDPELFRVANRQHVRNAVEVSEHNVASCLFEMRTGKPRMETDAREEPSRGEEPTRGVEPSRDEEPTRDDPNDSAGPDGSIFHETWKSLRVAIVGPVAFEKAFLVKPKPSNAFDAAIVGAWHAQRITPALGLAMKDLRANPHAPGVLIVEGSKYCVFSDAKASAAFTEKTSELANGAGFEPVAEDDSEPEDVADDDVTENGFAPDGSRRPRRARCPGVVKGVDDVHRCYVKTSERVRGGGDRSVSDA